MKNAIEEAWGIPIPLPGLKETNMSDAEYLEAMLGPQRMGYQV